MPLSSVIGGLFGIGSSIINNKYAEEREQQAREENYKYGEMAAENADVRTRALYGDLYSPSAQLNQLKEAGLSPSLFYGDGGGIAGQSGAQGTGAAGISPNVFGVDPMIAANVNLMEAQAKKANAEANRISGKGKMGEADLTLTLSQVGLNEASTHVKNAEAAIQDIKLEIDRNTKEYKIWEVQAKAKTAMWNTEQAMWEAKSSEQNFNFEKDTYQDRCNQIRENVLNTAADTFLKKAQKELTEEQKKQVKASISQMWEQLRLEGEKIGLMRTSIENQKEYWNKTIEVAEKQLGQQLEMFSKQLTQQYVSMGVNAVTNIIGGGVMGAITKGLFGGGGNYTPGNTTNGTWF